MSVIPAIVRDELFRAAEPRRTGRVTRVVGLKVEVDGVAAAVGDSVRIHHGGRTLDAEVVAVEGSTLACMPLGDLTGVRYGDTVTSTGAPLPIQVGPGLLGRVVDGLGRPLDGRPLPADCLPVSVAGSAPTRCGGPRSTDR